MGVFSGSLTFKQYQARDPLPEDWKASFQKGIAFIFVRTLTLEEFRGELELPNSGFPSYLVFLNTHLAIISLSILAILSKYFEFRFTFCAHFRNLEGLEGFHSLCLQHLANTGPHRLSILTNFHFCIKLFCLLNHWLFYLIFQSFY